MTMNFPMTFSTSRHNIKPVFFGISFPVVVLLCLLGAIIALEGIGSGQFAISDSVAYSLVRLNQLRMNNFISFRTISGSDFIFLCLLIFLKCFEISCFTFLTLSITFLECFISFALIVFFLAGFTIMLKSFSFMFVKLRNWFDLLAFITIFCLNCLRHNRLLYRRLMLEPVAVHTIAVGSFYYKLSVGFIK